MTHYLLASYSWCIKMEHFIDESYRAESPEFSDPNNSRWWSLTLRRDGSLHMMRSGFSSQMIKGDLNLHTISDSSINGELYIGLRDTCSPKTPTSTKHVREKFKLAPSSTKYTFDLTRLADVVAENRTYFTKSEYELHISLFFNDTFEVKCDVAEARYLSSDLGQLFIDNDFSDITIKVNNKSYSAHKCILAARSTVFKTMLHTNMQETISNCIIIDDIDEEVFEEMLRFIYTETVPNLDELVFELFSAADKYDLKGLRTLCEQKLCAIMTEKNVLKLLILADAHSADAMKNQAMEFIKRHRYDEHLKNEILNELGTYNNVLLKELLGNLMTK